MLLVDYIKYVITNGLILNSTFVKIMFSLPIPGNKNEFYKIVNNKYVVIIEDKEFVIEDIDIKNPIFRLDYSLTVEPDWIINVDKPTKTTLGILLLNYVILIYNFKDKIKYVKDNFNITTIENDYIADLLVDDTDTADDKISIAEYINFVSACKYVETWADVLVVSNTIKTLLPPPGLAKLKKEIIEDIKKKYKTDNPFTDLTAVGELETRLKEIDKEYLKDDPTLGIVTGDKALNAVRTKLFLTMGSEAGFTTNTKFVSNSLYDGWPTDSEELAGLFNSSRLGSYSRGVETQDGGLLAKIMLRATNSIKIVPIDCKTKTGKKVFVTKDNLPRIIGKRLLANNEVITDEQANSYINKTVIIRSPQYCKAPNNNFCMNCVSEGLSDRENGISILVTDIGNAILYISMKKMHNTQIEFTDVDLIDICS